MSGRFTELESAYLANLIKVKVIQLLLPCSGVCSLLYRKINGPKMSPKKNKNRNHILDPVFACAQVSFVGCVRTIKEQRWYNYGTRDRHEHHNYTAFVLR